MTIAFSVVGIDNWQGYVTQDPRFMRPAEVDVLRGDYSKAERELGWKPETSLQQMVEKMVKNDIRILEKEITR